MKKMIFLLMVLSISITAQTQDSVDIRAIVQKQIDAALERNHVEQIKRDSLSSEKTYFGPLRNAAEEKVAYFGPEPEYFGPVEPPVVAAIAKDTLALAKNKISQPAIQNIVNAPLLAVKKDVRKPVDGYWKFYVIGGVALAAFSFIIIRRLSQKHSKKQGKSIKNNIRIMREENVIKKRELPQLKIVRSQLLNSPVILNNHGKPLSAVAKELNISQGEIILAAKIKSYELAKDKNSKWYLN